MAHDSEWKAQLGQVEALLKGKDEVIKMMAASLKASDDQCVVMKRDLELKDELIGRLRNEMDEVDGLLEKQTHRVKVGKLKQENLVKEVENMRKQVLAMTEETQRFKRLNDDLIGKLKVTLDDIDRPTVSTKHSLKKDITKGKMVAKLHETSARSFLEVINYFNGTKQEYVPGMTLGIGKQPPIVETKKDSSE